MRRANSAGLSFRSFSLVAVIVGVCAVSAARPAPAQEAPAVSPAVLQALKDRMVILRLRDGREVFGRVLGTGETVVMATVDGTVFELPAGTIVAARLAPAPAPLPPPTIAPEQPRAARGDEDTEALRAPRRPERPRYVGVTFGLAPSVNIDVDYGLFHGFATGSLVFPMATSGQLLPFSVGAGFGVPVSSKRPNLKLDLFFMVAPIAGYSPSGGGGGLLAAGVGLGMHYTWDNGLTMGFTAPILGYSTPIDCTPDPTYGYGCTNESGSAVGMFYLAGAMALPLGFLGYRF